MNIEMEIGIALSLCAIAILYSSVGHAGASGYIAVLSLFGVAPTAIRPIALILNIAVAAIASWHFYKAGYFSFALYWRFALFAIPLSLVGGYISLPVFYLKVAIGVILVFSALRFFFEPKEYPSVRPPATPVTLTVGSGLGLLSGLTGTGGGIFLTPLMIFCRWAFAKNAAGISAVFILTNSIAGLAGNFGKSAMVPSGVWYYLPAVFFGGFVGSRLGARRLNQETVKRMLAVVLLIAGAKLILTR